MLRHLCDHNRVGVLILYMMLNAELGEELRQNVVWKAGLALVKIARNQFNWQHAAPLKVKQQRQHRIRILAA